ncbi:MAG: YitT family protein [Traorella sp.]
MKDSKKFIKKIICIIIGSIIMAANIKIFVRAGDLFPGGIAGLTLLIQKSFSKFLDIELPYSLLNYTLNLFPAIIGFKMVGKKFTMYSCIQIALSGFLVDIIPQQKVTVDPLLISVFGGILNGTAIGIILRGGASTGGMDFIGVLISEKFRQNSWNYILAFNVLLLMVAGTLFGWEAALYSIIFQFASTQVVNTLHNRYRKETLNIMTTKADEIQDKLLVYTHHGVTRFEGMGCYLKENVTMLYTVVDQNQIKDVIRLVREIDEHAFINIMNTKSLEGNFYTEPIE